MIYYKAGGSWNVILSAGWRGGNLQKGRPEKLRRPTLYLILHIAQNYAESGYQMFNQDFQTDPDQDHTAQQLCPLAEESAELVADCSADQA